MLRQKIIAIAALSSMLAAFACGASASAGTRAEAGAAATIAAGTAAAAAPDRDGPPRIGAAAPAFSLPGMDGGSYSLDRFRGKPVVLNFWASWCGPCRDEAPSLAKLAKEFGPELQVVAINLTDVDSEQSAREFVGKYGFAFPVLLDEKGSAADSYRIRPIPTTFFIGADGVIRDGVLGAMSWDMMRSRAEKLLRPAE